MRSLHPNTKRPIYRVNILPFFLFLRSAVLGALSGCSLSGESWAFMVVFHLLLQVLDLMGCGGLLAPSPR